MSVLLAIPERDRLQAVLIVREGLGYAVGAGSLIAGRIDRRHSAHIDERAAQAAALALSDELDLIVVRA